jgi:hypothetical protein
MFVGSDRTFAVWLGQAEVLRLITSWITTQWPGSR